MSRQAVLIKRGDFDRSSSDVYFELDEGDALLLRARLDRQFPTGNPKPEPVRDVIQLATFEERLAAYEAIMQRLTDGVSLKIDGSPISILQEMRLILAGVIPTSETENTTS